MTSLLFQPFPMAGRARGQIWRYAPAYRRPRHFHAEPELNLITAGHGAFGSGEAVVRVGPGDLLWWLPGQDHVLLGASRDFDLFVVGVEPALSDRVLGSAALAAHAGPMRVHLPGEVWRRLGDACMTPFEQLEAAVAERLVAEIWRDAHSTRASAIATPPSPALARRTLDLLQARPDLGRQELARLARGVPSEVSRHFRRSFGLKLTDYRSRLRLLRFIEEVDAGRCSLLSAAFAAGFGSYSQCHRTFSAAFGCTPRQFFEAGARGRMQTAFEPATKPLE